MTRARLDELARTITGRDPQLGTGADRREQVTPA
jgi:hypothetical protein